MCVHTFYRPNPISGRHDRSKSRSPEKAVTKARDRAVAALEGELTLFSIVVVVVAFFSFLSRFFSDVIQAGEVILRPSHSYSQDSYYGSTSSCSSS
ncbi:unnamed protein product [Trichobilharzia regenti]|nr:unnamed protein product [Trichobilharzia regenti]